MSGFDPQALLDPSVYPHPVGQLQMLETHISWVILTGDWAYKLKKPVDFGFLNYTTLERRENYCHEEIRLNGRLAPDVYVGVVPLKSNQGRLRFEGEGETVEFAVKMRQFPQAGLYDRQLEKARLSVAQMSRLGRRVGLFHQAAARALPESHFGHPQQVQAPCLDNFVTLLKLEPTHRPALEVLQRWTERQFQSLVSVFQERKQGAFIRELHGDLHLGNIAEIDGQPVPFDGIEFDPELRWVDTMNDLAFLLSDLEHRERPDLGRVVLDAYLEQTGDYAGLVLWDYYVIYRWMVRAKVVALRKLQGHPEVAEEIACYLSQALRRIRPRPVRLMVTHGLSGSGKSHHSFEMLQREELVRLRSDVVRKSLAGLPPLSRSLSAPAQGLYTPQQGQQTYQKLCSLAESLLSSGHSVLIDAACLKRQQRELFRQLAWQLKVPFQILAYEAPESLLRQRIQDRLEQGSDPSDADLSVLEYQLKTCEPLGSDETDVVYPLRAPSH
ncbi:AAA family ATPase [bacterium]|nr:AAA family ATPase [bacterium]